LVCKKNVSRLVAEREVFSVDHGYIGAALLENGIFLRGIKGSKISPFTR
jgi:hypothetical protein